MEDATIYNYVIVAGKQYKTGLAYEMAGSLSFNVYDMTVEQAANAFSAVKEFDVLDSDCKTVKGMYGNMSFRSASVDATGTVTVCMALEDDASERLAVLEKAQAEQEEALVSLLYGGGEEE